MTIIATICDMLGRKRQTNLAGYVSSGQFSFKESPACGMGSPRLGKQQVTGRVLRQHSTNGGWIYVDFQLDAPLRNRLKALAIELDREDDFLELNFDQSIESRTYNVLIDGSPHTKAVRVVQVCEDVVDAAHAVQLSVALPLLEAFFSVFQVSCRSVGVTAVHRFLATRSWHDACIELLATQPASSMAHQQLVRALEPFKSSGSQYSATLRDEAFGQLSLRLATLVSAIPPSLMENQSPQVSFPAIREKRQMCYVTLPATEASMPLQYLSRMLLNDLYGAAFTQEPQSLKETKPFLIGVSPPQSEHGRSPTAPEGAWA